MNTNRLKAWLKAKLTSSISSRNHNKPKLLLSLIRIKAQGFVDLLQPESTSESSGIGCREVNRSGLGAGGIWIVMEPGTMGGYAVCDPRSLPLKERLVVCYVPRAPPAP